MPSAALPAPLVARLADVSSVGVITGAGISAESGVPTYRGTGGLYDDAERGDDTVEALSGPTLRADPDRTWRAVADLARRSASARPNAAHHALAAIERRVERFVLLTQNVDGLHQLAGSRNVVPIHGDVFAVRCTRCPHHGRLDRERLPELDGAPRCPDCGGVLRPDAVLFGERLDPRLVDRMDAELIAAPPDLVLAVGTSALFPYIAAPILHAAAGGRLTVEVNPEPTVLTGTVDHVLAGPAGTWVPLVAEALGAG